MVYEKDVIRCEEGPQWYVCDRKYKCIAKCSFEANPNACKVK